MFCNDCVAQLQLDQAICHKNISANLQMWPSHREVVGVTTLKMLKLDSPIVSFRRYLWIIYLNALDQQPISLYKK